jgi:hypothetical protein
MPHTTFFLSANDTPILEDDPIWRAPLPLTPQKVVAADAPGKDSAITYGVYFTAIRRFIEQDRFSNLTCAIRDLTGQTVLARDLGTINICLEKHGQFYHPARLTVDADGRQASFVVNVAVTAIGRSYLHKDFVNIRALNNRFPYRFLPQVYSSGAVLLPDRSYQVEMFIGQWLAGYHEFHLSGIPAEGNDRLLVWDSLNGAHRLSDQTRCDVYRQAAQILTAYYNLETFEQVFSWHHAAGDFIVKNEGQNVKVRLITVRKYAPLFDGTGTDAQTIFQALLIFLLNLTVKMRLDRLDGVGAMAWAGDDTVAATLDGFFGGLLLQLGSDRIPAELPDIFVAYLKSLTAAEFNDLLAAVFERTFRQTPESKMIRKHLKHHGLTLCKAIDLLPRNWDSTPI